jgi:Biopolymer transport protein ExbD/TolR
MASSSEDGVDEGRLDLVPMIDCIMLLLLFFMMTTKFSSEEKAISSLLPTDKGQAAASPQQKDPPQMVNISIYPAGMVKGSQPSDYMRQLQQIQPTPGTIIGKAYLRIGGRDPIEIDGRNLNSKGGDAMKVLVDQIHSYVETEVSKFEKAGLPRNKQNDVVIHCFSGLSWKYALVVYDAVRAYEGKAGQFKYTGNPEELMNARAVTFAPPRVRNYSAKELGDELYEIVHMK